MVAGTTFSIIFHHFPSFSIIFHQESCWISHLPRRIGPFGRCDPGAAPGILGRKSWEVKFSHAPGASALIETVGKVNSETWRGLGLGQLGSLSINDHS